MSLRNKNVCCLDAKRHWKAFRRETNKKNKLQGRARRHFDISLRNSKINQNLLSFVMLTGSTSTLWSSPTDFNLQNLKKHLRMLLWNARRLQQSSRSSCACFNSSMNVHMFTAMHIYFNFLVLWRHNHQTTCSSFLWAVMKFIDLNFCFFF